MEINWWRKRFFEKLYLIIETKYGSEYEVEEYYVCSCSSVCVCCCEVDPGAQPAPVIRHLNWTRNGEFIEQNVEAENGFCEHVCGSGGGGEGRGGDEGIALAK